MLLGGPAQSWLATPASRRLLSRMFEDGAVCFDPETCETLLLSPLASFLLELWQQHGKQALTRDELLAEVLAVDDSTADPALAEAQLDQALDELQRAGLAACGAAS